jgi:hypothetical protein
MMLYSAEARWFIPERLPDIVLEWFKAGRPIDSEGEHVHEYLSFPGCECVGVKLRDGRLEIKAMRGSSEPLGPGLCVAGRKEQWVKWSLAGDALRTLDGPLHQSGQWLKVSKERFLRRFYPEQGGATELKAGQGPLLATGCNIEVCRVEVDAETRYWFTIGFEAFGPPQVITGILDNALVSFFKDNGPMPGRTLTGNESTGYPAWLLRLMKPYSP